MAVSAQIARKLFDRRLSAAKHALVTIYREGIPKFRFCTAGRNMTVNGQTYVARAIPRIQYPQQVARRRAMIRLEIDNSNPEVKLAINADAGSDVRWTFDVVHCLVEPRANSTSAIFEEAKDYRISVCTSSERTTDTEIENTLTIEGSPWSIRNRALYTLSFDPASFDKVITR